MSLAAGNLRHRATIKTLAHDLRPRDRGKVWCSITSLESASPAMPTGLRTGARVDVRCRYNPKLAQGVYLFHAGRILQATSVRDPLGQRAELVLTCDEFVGQRAEYRSGQAAPIDCRVHLDYSAPYLDELGQVTDYRVRAIVLLIEVGRPQAGDTITVDGQRFVVTQYDKMTDDASTRALWLEAV